MSFYTILHQINKLHKATEVLTTKMRENRTEKKAGVELARPHYSSSLVPTGFAQIKIPTQSFRADWALAESLAELKSTDPWGLGGDGWNTK